MVLRGKIRGRDERCNLRVRVGVRANLRNPTLKFNPNITVTLSLTLANRFPEKISNCAIPAAPCSARFLEAYRRTVLAFPHVISKKEARPCGCRKSGRCVYIHPNGLC